VWGTEVRQKGLVGYCFRNPECSTRASNGQDGDRVAYCSVSDFLSLLSLLTTKEARRRLKLKVRLEIIPPARAKDDHCFLASIEAQFVLLRVFHIVYRSHTWVSTSLAYRVVFIVVYTFPALPICHAFVEFVENGKGR
jgi:hypothetical protein